MKKINLSEEQLYLVIIGAMITLFVGLGFPIANSVHDSVTNSNLRYLRAVQIETESLFDYAIRTEVGDMLSQGTFKANEPVTHESLDGEFWSIIRIEEHEEERTRTVTYECGTADNPQTCTRIETYWVWVERGRETWSTKTFNYLGQDFKTNELDGISFNFHSHELTERGRRHWGNRVRFIYQTIPVNFNGTVYSFAVDGEITNNNLFRNRTIDQVVASSESAAGNAVVGFWIFWVLIGTGVTFFIIKYVNDNYDC